MKPQSLDARQRTAWNASLALTLLRLLLAPVILTLAWNIDVSGPLVAVLFLALVSDILDGRVLAWANVEAPGLRALDSAVDTVFYVSAAIAAWHRRPIEIGNYWRGILIVLTLEVTNNVFGLIKYRRTPGYHAYSAKLFGLALFTTLVLLLGGASVTLLPITLGLGVVTQAESLAITAMLGTWTHDVPSVWHAWRQRQQT